MIIAAKLFPSSLSSCHRRDSIMFFILLYFIFLFKRKKGTLQMNTKRFSWSTTRSFLEKRRKLESEVKWVIVRYCFNFSSMACELLQLVHSRPLKSLIASNMYCIKEIQWWSFKKKKARPGPDLDIFVDWSFSYYVF